MDAFMSNVESQIEQDKVGCLDFDLLPIEALLDAVAACSYALAAGNSWAGLREQLWVH